ncbi:MAG: lactonase family protein [Prevotella sp.]|jgi:6-phosphogluconolactonase|nr:lactonase family protein [Prevotella sp.]MCI1281032.1 lactonase family protein [Prevotella sp.]
MKRILSLLLLAASLNAMAQDEIKLIVGTYTNGSSKGIYTFNFNQQTGETSPLDTLAVKNPSYLNVSSDGKMIYAVSENGDATAAINAISFNSTTGKMKLINSQLTKGEDPCYVEMNDNFLLTANYSGGSMSLFPLNLDGSLRPMAQQFKGTIGGPYSPNQDTPHIHCATFTPDGNYVLASDFSADRILKFEILGIDGIKPAGIAGTLKAGSGPRHIIFSNDSRFFYVMSELSGAVTAYIWNFGKPRKIQEIQSDSVEGHGGADIHFSIDGKYLYTSNRLKQDGISIFKVDKRSGRLTKIGYQLTGVHPRNFGITPNGKYLLCACRDDNKIQVFRINQTTGMLEDTHKDIAVDKPVCVKFYPFVMQPGFGDGQFRVMEKK